MKITYQQLIKDSHRLSEIILASFLDVKKGYTSVFGIPSGGILPAYIISNDLGLPFIGKPEVGTLIVDDLIDSGKTLERFKDFNSAVIYRKKHSPNPTYFSREIPNEWVELPHEKEETGIEEHIVRMLEYIGENPNREGLKDTPKRIIKMWDEIYKGYKNPVPQIIIFGNQKDGINYDQMIIDTGDFYSICEHHMIPFFGKYYFAYIPDKKLLGLSKIARIVDYFSSKLQIQERLTKEIVDETEKQIEPLGIALILKGRHLCKEMRGVKNNGEMITSDLRGVFRDQSTTRIEFLNLIKC